MIYGGYEHCMFEQNYNEFIIRIINPPRGLYKLLSKTIYGDWNG